MRKYVLTILSLIWFLAGSCAVDTRYVLAVDLLSFVESPDRGGTIPVPQAPGSASLYLFPGVQLDLVDAGPDSVRRTGELISTHLPNPPGAYDLSVHFEAEVDLTNRGAGVLPSLSSDIYLAGETSANVYTDGILVSTSAIPNLAPGEVGTFDLSFSIQDGDPAYTILEARGFRIGCVIRVTGNALGITDCEYTLRIFEIDVEGYPIAGILESGFTP